MILLCPHDPCRTTASTVPHMMAHLATMHGRDYPQASREAHELKPIMDDQPNPLRLVPRGTEGPTNGSGA